MYDNSGERVFLFEYFDTFSIDKAKPTYWVYIVDWIHELNFLFTAIFFTLGNSISGQFVSLLHKLQDQYSQWHFLEVLEPTNEGGICKKKQSSAIIYFLG